MKEQTVKVEKRKITKELESLIAEKTTKKEKNDPKSTDQVDQGNFVNDEKIE